MAAAGLLRAAAGGGRGQWKHSRVAHGRGPILPTQQGQPGRECSGPAPLSSSAPKPTHTHVLLRVAVPPRQVGSGGGGGALAPLTPLPAALAAALTPPLKAAFAAALAAPLPAALAAALAPSPPLAVAKAAAAVTKAAAAVAPPAVAKAPAAPVSLVKAAAPAVLPGTALLAALPPPLALLRRRHGHAKGRCVGCAPGVQPCCRLIPHTRRIGRRCGWRRGGAARRRLLRLHGRLPAPAAAAAAGLARRARRACCSGAAAGLALPSKVKGRCRRVKPAAEGARVLRGGLL